MSALDLIADERRHQIEDRGFTPEHDAEHGDDRSLVEAALVYLNASVGRDTTRDWPWERESCKPRGLDDPLHDLVKAGALIAAEIDRLQAANAT